MADPIKRFVPTLTHMLYYMCRFIRRHYNVIEAMINEYGGDHKADLSTALSNINAACNLFMSLMHTIDENWKP